MSENHSDAEFSVLESDVAKRIPYFKGWKGFIRFFVFCLALLSVTFYLAFYLNEHGARLQRLVSALHDTAQQWTYLLSTAGGLTVYAAYKQSWLDL
jgi:hypothetical protein